jgi:hypothetical protein
MASWFETTFKPVGSLRAADVTPRGGGSSDPVPSAAPAAPSEPTTPKLSERIAAAHPELFARIRRRCVYGSADIDLDDHAARIVVTIAGARAR